MSLIKWSLLVAVPFFVGVSGCGGSSCDTGVDVGVTATFGDPWGASGGGDTSGDTSGGDTSGGDTSGGDTSGGDTSGGDTSGDTSGGDDGDDGISSTGDGIFSSAISSGPTPASSMRKTVHGDAFGYAVQGFYSTPNGPQNQPLSGTAVETFAVGSAGTIDTLTAAVTLNGTRQGQSLQRELNTGGQIVAETGGGALQTVRSGALTLPPSLGPTVSLSALLGLANGTSVAETYKVTGYNTITEPAGSYACWRVSESLTYSNGTSIRRTSWIAPQLGAPVKEVIQTAFLNGYTQNLTLRLTSKTLR